MRSIVYSRTTADGLSKRLRLKDGSFGTSKIEFAYDWVRVWRKCDEVVDVGRAGAWGTRSTDATLGIPSLSMVSVYDWTLMTWTGAIMIRENLL